jgi:diguanylate cyclase (GGDEF)-like protein
MLDNELCRRGGSNVAVMLLDLDGFKQVNDTLGHDAGDQLLKLLAGRLCDGVRAGDLVARLGGDEFVVMLAGITSDAAARRVADGIRRLLEEPVVVGRWRFPPGVSVGVAVAPGDGIAPRELMRRADERMYEAKRARRQDGRADVVAIEAAS